MKIIVVSIVIILAVLCLGACTSKVSGDVFIATNGAGVYKLGAVQMKFFRKSGVPNLKSDEKTDWDKLSPVAETTTDSEGRFTVTLPHGDYIVVAHAYRLLTGHVRAELYNWEAPLSVSGSETKLSLNNQNLLDEPDPLNSHSEPFIGMSFTDFSRMCGDLDSSNGDAVREFFKDPRNKTLLTYQYSDYRGINGCYGQFTFEDGLISNIERH